MKSTVETIDPARIKLTVEVPYEELKPSLDAAYQEIGSQIQVPGFRRGHVPTQVIDQRVGRGAVIQEAVNEALPEFFGKAVDETGVSPIGQPEVDITEVPMADGEQLKFTVEVDVRPEITLPDYDGIEITVDNLEVTDEDVEAKLTELRERFGTLVGVDRAVETGDFVSIDLKAEIDGDEIDSVGRLLRGRLRHHAPGHGRGARGPVLLSEWGPARLWWARHRLLGASQSRRYRLALTYELARRRAYARGVVLGEPLQMLREGRLEVGRDVLLEPWVWLTGGESGRITIGRGTFLNLGVMIAALEKVSIGQDCMIANHCFVGDSDHRFDDPTRPFTAQGFVSKGPTRIGDSCWLGVGAVVTSGVSIGDRCVIGANAVVTRDVPAGSIAVGAPAQVVGRTDGTVDHRPT